MSVENVNRFFEKVSENTELQEQLNDLAAREKSIYEDLAALGAANGITFTAREVLMARVSKANEAELSEEELDTVAGGYCYGLPW